MTKTIAKDKESLTSESRETPSKEALLQHLLQTKAKLKRIKDVDAKRTQEILNKDIHVKSTAREAQQLMSALQHQKSALSKEDVLEKNIEILYANCDILSGSLDILKVYIDDLLEKVETINTTLNKTIDIQRLSLQENTQK